MAQFLPFRGVRYDATRLPEGGFDVLVAPPYDVIDDDERALLASRDEHNSVRLILPEGDETERYDTARDDFRAWRESGLLVRDLEPAFYLYRMRFHDEEGAVRVTRGVIGALGLPDGGDDTILPHERTLPKAKSDRLSLLRATRANFEPIWGLSLAGGLSALLEPPAADPAGCVDDEGVEHALWPVTESSRLAAVARTVASAPLVLADGHHRFETAIAYRDERRTRGEVDGAGSIMTLVVELADDELTVRPIHRLLTRVPNGLDVRAALGPMFTVVDAGPNTGEGVATLTRRMRDEGGLGLVDAGGLAVAHPRPEVVDGVLADLPEPVRHVDAAVFEQVIMPALGSPDVVYRHDAAEVAALVDKGAATGAVLLRPVTVAQIRDVAFAGARMPQKTTFFQPKPRTGLVFRTLD